MKKTILNVLLLLVLMSRTGAAAEFGIDQYLALSSISELSVSPDGRHVGIDKLTLLAPKSGYSARLPIQDSSRSGRPVHDRRCIRSADAQMGDQRVSWRIGTVVKY